MWDSCGESRKGPSFWEALRGQGLSSTRASQVLGLPRSTLYRWQGRLKAQGPKGLEERSRRPHRCRQPTWSPQLVQALLRWREGVPRWGKDRLVVLLRRGGGGGSGSRGGRRP